jgi:transcriptional regulator with XRE-family HTH domain
VGETLGDRLKLARTYKGVTQVQVAKDLYLTSRLLSQCEHDICLPKLDTVVDLAKYYGVSIAWLLGVASDMNPKDREMTVEDTAGKNVGKCPVCGLPVSRSRIYDECSDHYCRHCGQKLRWE